MTHSIARLSTAALFFEEQLIVIPHYTHVQYQDRN